eukprot:gnl/TRDRNA2_/TRDRNA2_176366_c0_seq2.p1 gnl/TRDRNA2_/TRDRNA2_176366_c0~~gnl/TRDRNA2_/TRDRNA2_176366_c0_seq2.p1  ORF type:complete len:338 (-),score=34.44 gnl/TRDRNA2_/TRDRNA2_176366_c0_seq2:14-1027(-)
MPDVILPLSEPLLRRSIFVRAYCCSWIALTSLIPFLSMMIWKHERLHAQDPTASMAFCTVSAPLSRGWQRCAIHSGGGRQRHSGDPKAWTMASSKLSRGMLSISRSSNAGGGPHDPDVVKSCGPISDALVELLPKEVEGLALEIGSGTGAHMEHFAKLFPRLRWQPSEYLPQDPTEKFVYMADLAIIDSVGADVLPNVMPAVALDASRVWAEWPERVQEQAGQFSLVYCSNVFHISPWEVTQGIIRGAAAALQTGGLLITYGLYKIDGELLTDGSKEFDSSLRAVNSLWGIRDVSDIELEAKACGFALKEQRILPESNGKSNYLLVFELGSANDILQ